MTGFIAYVFPYPNRVSFQEAFEVLEPDDGKLSRPVLRGPVLSNGVRLLDRGRCLGWAFIGISGKGRLTGVQHLLFADLPIRCTN
jgi:hypothetical protein